MLTKERIEQAVNEGADVVLDGLDLGDRDRDLLGLTVCAIVYQIFHPAPGSELDDVIREHYEDSPEEVRKWWDW
ncbi:hypothetical protein ABZ714_13105 [Streptomyces sp. NPDC006798]|uniref:hypothetical protein n=1 Tax=Streptomyces sp. NPDC006798 TaxID=3155462 RepID=UPI0033C9CFD2